MRQRAHTVYRHGADLHGVSCATARVVLPVGFANSLEILLFK
jgi:hypothetical protein